ncbi:hypothetical protein Pelo_11245 [Pelomyxa schiedti]|nr:hypothetical protein Pelo_11245 [Pelomyxa schiedti]
MQQQKGRGPRGRSGGTTQPNTQSPSSTSSSSASASSGSSMVVLGKLRTSPGSDTRGQQPSEGPLRGKAWGGSAPQVQQQQHQHQQHQQQQQHQREYNESTQNSGGGGNNSMSQQFPSLSRQQQQHRQAPPPLPQNASQSQPMHPPIQLPQHPQSQMHQPQPQYQILTHSTQHQALRNEKNETHNLSPPHIEPQTSVRPALMPEAQMKLSTKVSETSGKPDSPPVKIQPQDTHTEIPDTEASRWADVEDQPDFTKPPDFGDQPNDEFERQQYEEQQRIQEEETRALEEKQRLEKAKEEQRRQQEERRRQEQQRQEERKRQELQRQEEHRRQEEQRQEQRRQELQRQEEQRRQEEQKRQQEEQKRRQEEQRRQQEEQRRQQEEQKRRQELEEQQRIAGEKLQEEQRRHALAEAIKTGEHNTVPVSGEVIEPEPLKAQDKADLICLDLDSIRDQPKMMKEKALQKKTEREREEQQRKTEQREKSLAKLAELEKRIASKNSKAENTSVETSVQPPASEDATSPSSPAPVHLPPPHNSTTTGPQQSHGSSLAQSPSLPPSTLTPSLPSPSPPIQNSALTHLQPTALLPSPVQPIRPLAVFPPLKPLSTHGTGLLQTPPSYSRTTSLEHSPSMPPHSVTVSLPPVPLQMHTQSSTLSTVQSAPFPVVDKTPDKPLRPCSISITRKSLPNLPLPSAPSPSLSPSLPLAGQGAMAEHPPQPSTGDHGAIPDPVVHLSTPQLPSNETQGAVIVVSRSPTPDTIVQTKRMESAKGAVVVVHRKPLQPSLQFTQQQNLQTPSFLPTMANPGSTEHTENEGVGHHMNIPPYQRVIVVQPAQVVRSISEPPQRTLSPPMKPYIQRVIFKKDPAHSSLSSVHYIQQPIVSSDVHPQHSDQETTSDKQDPNPTYQAKQCVLPEDDTQTQASATTTHLPSTPPLQLPVALSPLLEKTSVITKSGAKVNFKVTLKTKTAPNDLIPPVTDVTPPPQLQQVVHATGHSLLPQVPIDPSKLVPGDRTPPAPAPIPAVQAAPVLLTAPVSEVQPFPVPITHPAPVQESLADAVHTSSTLLAAPAVHSSPNSSAQVSPSVSVNSTPRHSPRNDQSQAASKDDHKTTPASKKQKKSKKEPKKEPEPDPEKGKKEPKKKHKPEAVAPSEQDIHLKNITGAQKGIEHSDGEGEFQVVTKGKKKTPNSPPPNSSTTLSTPTGNTEAPKGSKKKPKKGDGARAVPVLHFQMDPKEITGKASQTQQPGQHPSHEKHTEPRTQTQVETQPTQPHSQPPPQTRLPPLPQLSQLLPPPQPQPQQLQQQLPQAQPLLAVQMHSQTQSQVQAPLMSPTIKRVITYTTSHSPPIIYGSNMLVPPADARQLSSQLPLQNFPQVQYSGAPVSMLPRGNMACTYQRGGSAKHYF